MRQYRKRFSLIVFGLWLLSPAAVLAASQNGSNAVAQSYSTTSDLQTGMIVEPETGKTQAVMPLKSNDVRHMLGVVVSANSATIVLVPNQPSQQQVLVATQGDYNVLVSNQNGAIKAGDYITISSIDGIGMAAGSSQPEVIGRAETGFGGTGSSVSTAQVKNDQGHNQNVVIGSIAVNVNVAPNPLYQTSPVLIPGFANSFVTTVTGKQVSPVRIYLAAVLLIITTFIVISILFGSVRGSMIALGRNPLSKQSIMRSLLVTVMTVIVIFGTGVFAVYLLLKL